ncbi:MAG TPA: hypothetical protein VJU18_18435 [Vicinamibacteria bacterium]|nr:hypothetical protein [Vicinamibacteria bacterium]
MSRTAQATVTRTLGRGATHTPVALVRTKRIRSRRGPGGTA